MYKSILLVALLFNMAFGANAASGGEIIQIPVSDDIEIQIERYTAKGKYLMIWLAPEYGLRDNHRAMAVALSKENIEVWMSDIAESLFLPQGSTSLKKINGQYVADMIEYAHKQTGKQIVVSGDSYAALPALSGARQWQSRRHKERYLVGAVLFSPFAFSHIPSLGQAPQYMPIVDATNIPIMIYQARNSPNFGQFKNLLGRLQQHGNPVYSRLTPRIMSLFYSEDATPEMKTQAALLPKNIRKMITRLDKYDVPIETIPIRTQQEVRTGIDIQLKTFKGLQTPVAISLKDIDGKQITKSNYTGQVTIINFWATWCRPCIEEIPSLNRLKNKMTDFPFELISINYAEEKDAVRKFMQMVDVAFPVLLDHDGKLTKQWNVISFPSTFVIDPTGKIRYGVNGAIDWDDPELVQTLKAMY